MGSYGKQWDYMGINSQLMGKSYFLEPYDYFAGVATDLACYIL